jgi:hypothetical protein
MHEEMFSTFEISILERRDRVDGFSKLNGVDFFGDV